MSGREQTEHSTRLAPWRKLYDQRKRKFVSPEELAACRQDPRTAKTIRGPDAIVCLECGQLVRVMSGHLDQEHQITAAEYKAKPGPDGVTRRYNKSTSLSCDSVRQARSKRWRTAPFLRRLAAVRPPAHKMRGNLFAARRSAQVSQEDRLNKADLVRGTRHPDRWKHSKGQVVTDWWIAQLRLEGKTYQEISVVVGAGAPTIHERLRKMGFPAWRCRFLFGEPVAGQHMLQLCQDLGITKRKMSKLLHLSYERVWRQTVARKVERTLSIETADRLIEQRKSLLTEWRSTAATEKKGGHPRALLPNDERRMQSKYQKLRSELKALRNWLRDRDSSTMEDVWDWLCEQSRQGAIHLLLFLPEFYTWLEKENNQGQFLTGDWAPYDHAAEFLAKAYDVSQTIVRTYNPAQESEAATAG